MMVVWTKVVVVDIIIIGQILEIKLTEFSNRLDVSCARKTDVEDSFSDLSPPLHY